MTTKLSQKYGSWALVTGATSGIGRALAHELAAQHLNLVLVARDEVALGREHAALARAHGVEVRTVAADLAAPAGVDRVIAATRDLDVGIAVPCAGAMLVGELIAGAPDEHARLIQLNVTAPVLLARHYGREMALRGRGAILLVSSLFGYQGVPYVANYAATKAYILSFGEALAVELGRRNVDVTVLAPGLTDTRMAATIPLDTSKLPVRRQTPDRVARAAIRRLGRRRAFLPGLLNKLYAFQNRLVPRMVPVRIFGFLLRRALTGPARLVATLRPHGATASLAGARADQTPNIDGGTQS